MSRITKGIIDGIANSSEIVKHLFEADLNRLEEVLNKLVDDNDKLIGEYNTAGFMHQGEFYERTNATRSPGFGERHTLHPDLWARMSQYSREVSRLIMEVHIVNQTVYRLVRGCTTYQDVRDALPECLVKQDRSGKYSPLPRSREAAWTLVGDKLATSQYEKVLPAIEYYASTHLIF